jgi:chorismate--pyruvate lyase
MALDDARWMPLAQLRYNCTNPCLFMWLSDNSSLTQRLIDHCRGKFEVKLRGQGWGAPLPSESRLLGTRIDEYALVREVELLCDGMPHVYARTLMPKSSLRGRAAHLQGLGSRPLGALLFSDPTTRRTTIEYARLLKQHRLYERAMASVTSRADELWGRRTLFRYAGKPLLVNEIFLPAICEHHAASDRSSTTDE